MNTVLCDDDSIIHHFVAAAMIRRDDEILLIRQRGPEDPAAYWSIPGGKVKNGEAVTTAIVREIGEETGLDVDMIGPLAYATWIEKKAAARIQRTTALVYEVTTCTGDLHIVDPDGLVLEAAFVPCTIALKRLWGIPFEPMREPLLAYLGGQVIAASTWFYRPEAEHAIHISPIEAIPWQEIGYLATGTPRQRVAFACLNRLAIFADLRAYTPALIGTVPLDVDTDQSDLDIACFAPNLDEFIATVNDLYAALPCFQLKRKEIRGVPTVVASFRSDAFDLQVFAQTQPILAQYGYRHLVVESRLLAFGDDRVRETIRRSKLSGLKTEPAFARFFGLTGDPYEQLWNLSLVDEKALRDEISLS